MGHDGRPGHLKPFYPRSFTTSSSSSTATGTGDDGKDLPVVSLTELVPPHGSWRAADFPALSIRLPSAKLERLQKLRQTIIDTHEERRLGDGVARDSSNESKARKQELQLCRELQNLLRRKLKQDESATKYHGVDDTPPLLQGLRALDRVHELLARAAQTSIDLAAYTTPEKSSGWRKQVLALLSASAL